jgi:hypothetical protein
MFAKVDALPGEFGRSKILSRNKSLGTLVDREVREYWCAYFSRATLGILMYLLQESCHQGFRR